MSRGSRILIPGPAARKGPPVSESDADGPPAKPSRSPTRPYPGRPPNPLGRVREFENPTPKPAPSRVSFVTTPPLRAPKLLLHRVRRELGRGELGRLDSLCGGYFAGERSPRVTEHRRIDRVGAKDHRAVSGGTTPLDGLAAAASEPSGTVDIERTDIIAHCRGVWRVARKTRK